MDVTDTEPRASRFCGRCDVELKELGYPHELWTTRLLAQHVREHGPTAGHTCLSRIAQGTVCKILACEDVKPHKVRYYLERRDEDFEVKMAEVLCVYQEVAVLCADDKAAVKSDPKVAIISYDEKPGIQAISNTAPDLPPVPGAHPCMARDHEYKRHGTLSLLAGIDLLIDPGRGLRPPLPLWVVRSLSGPANGAYCLRRWAEASGHPQDVG